MTETVEEHCEHEDCMYRGNIRSARMAFCKYIMVTGKPRGCSISECDKYERGTVKKCSTLGGVLYVHEKGEKE